MLSLIDSYVTTFNHSGDHMYPDSLALKRTIWRVFCDYRNKQRTFPWNYPRCRSNGAPLCLLWDRNC